MGSIDLNNVKPEVHEYAALLTLAKHGKDIKLLPVSSKYKECSADFEMDGLIWELKCPQGKGKYVVRDILRKAAKQSNNIIVDLERMKLSQEKALGQLNKYFLLEKSLQRMLIITKSKNILDVQK